MLNFPAGANAAWSLGRWEEMGEFIHPIHDNDRNDVELHNKSSFYEAVYCIKLEKFNEAKELIELTRKRLAYAVSTLLSENYSRAYRGIVSLQILSELEEIIDFKRNVAINNHQANESDKNLDQPSNPTLNFNNNNNSNSSHHTKLKKSAFKSSNDITFPSYSDSNLYNSSYFKQGELTAIKLCCCFLFYLSLYCRHSEPDLNVLLMT
jgi:hypothetical protein